jgi:cytochrome P450
VIAVLDPVSAVTQADPYPFYAAWRAEGGFRFASGLRMWVASSAEAVGEVLANRACKVRPPAEPIPAALVGSPVGDVFARLMRMNDGPAHELPKRAIGMALAELDEAAVRAEAERCSRALLPKASISDWMHELSARVLGALLGCRDEELDGLARNTVRFVAALSPLATPEQREAGNAAAQEMLVFARHLQGSGLPKALRRAADGCDWRDEPAIVANIVGLFSQSHEATAGWIGNALVALGWQPSALARLRQEPQGLAAFVDEVSRHDPSVQNTRRFVATPTRVQGIELREGDAILLVLAAANRDPAFNPRPDEFDIDRHDRRSMTFGAAVHRCPGERLASAIVQGALATWIARSALPPEAVGYRPSVNVRIPLFER